jgi:hypothetical protein
MSTIRPTDRDLVPAGWVQTSWGDPLEFTHRQSGLRLEAVTETPSSRLGGADAVCWVMRCRKAVGETESTNTLGRVTTVRRARQRLAAGMQRFNRLSVQRDWDETVAVSTVTDALAESQSHRSPGAGADIRRRRG